MLAEPSCTAHSVRVESSQAIPESSWLRGSSGRSNQVYRLTGPRKSCCSVWRGRALRDEGEGEGAGAGVTERLQPKASPTPTSDRTNSRRDRGAVGLKTTTSRADVHGSRSRRPELAYPSE